jgi:hypothetical protein
MGVTRAPKNADEISLSAKSRKITALSVVATSDTTQTITATIEGVGFDGVSYEYSTDGVNYCVKGTSANGIYNATELTPDTKYFWRARLYKGSNYGTYSSVNYDRTLEPWYRSGGVNSLNVVAAYSPEGAADFASSLVNIAHPGVNDAIAVTNNPTWDAVNGWTHGADKALKTGIYANCNGTWSMVIKFSDYVSGDQYMIGSYESPKIFSIRQVSAENKIYGYGGSSNGTLTGILASGKLWIIGGNPDQFSGNAHLFRADDIWSTDKVVVGNASVGKPDSYSLQEIMIGAASYLGAPAGFFLGKIQKVAIYNSPLNEIQMKCISDAMDGIYTKRTKINNYINQRFGALVCFGYVTFNAIDSQIGRINGDVNYFNPTDLDIDEWLDSCVLAGMKYAICSAKHHDGFKMWLSSSKVGANPVYGIGSTNWYALNEIDYLAVFIEKCHSRGLKAGCSFSVRDYTWEAQTGTTEFTNAAGYLSMVVAEVTELANYDLDIMWFDGWAWMALYQYIPYKTIRDLVFSINPQITFVENAHAHPTYTSEIEQYETATVDGSIPSGNIRPSEETETIRNDGYWVWLPILNQSADTLQTKAFLQGKLQQVNLRKSTYLISITPDNTGHLPVIQKALIESLAS